MIYIAPDIFYYWLADDEEYGTRATEIILSIERKVKAVTSIYTLIELDQRFRDQENYTFSELLSRFTALKFLKLAKLDDGFLDEVLRAMKLYSLTIENGIHFTTAKNYKCESIFTTETSYQNTPLKITTL